MEQLTIYDALLFQGVDYIELEYKLCLFGAVGGRVPLKSEPLTPMLQLSSQSRQKILPNFTFLTLRQIFPHLLNFQYIVVSREVNKNYLLGGRFSIFLPQNPEVAG